MIKNDVMITNTQHFSINNELINYLDLSFIDDNIIEPFYGNGDLEKIVNKTMNEKYDIDEKFKDKCIIRDTLLNPPDYDDKFVITNLPYLAKNKMKELKETYKHLLSNDINDLYQIFINQLIDSNVKGGLLIIPINFLFGTETTNIRNKFLNIFKLRSVNIFEKKMFSNTTQSVIAFTFSREYDRETNYNLFTKTKTIKNISIDFTESAELLSDLNNDIKIERFTKQYQEPTHIKIILIDSTKLKIRAEYDDDPKINKSSDRSFMNVVCNVELTEEDEREIIEEFNNKLQMIRDNTHSLILSSYREFDRKRLDIKQAFNLLKHII